jgi:hypothetical protein
VRIRWINGLLFVERFGKAQSMNLSTFSHATHATVVHYQGRCIIIQTSSRKMFHGFGFQVVVAFFSQKSSFARVVAVWNTPMLGVAFLLSFFDVCGGVLFRIAPFLCNK